MPTNTDSLNFSFNISSIGISVSSDIRFNILKRRDIVTYQTLSDNNSVNLAYVYNQKLLSDTNITIVDKADELSDNRITDNKNITFTGKTVSLATNNFIATDKFLISQSGEKFPVYYKHVLSNFDPLDTNLKILDITLLDSAINNPVRDNIIFDYELGAVYNNIQNSFDLKSGDYTLTYVRYSIKNISSGIISSYLEILNNQSIYRQATFDDLLPDGTLPDTLQVYIAEENLFTNTFEITFPKIQTYSILEIEESRIHAFKPKNLDSDSSWFISVTNGDFFTTLKTTTTTTNVFRYNIPEFGSQLFSPFSPYMHVSNENSDMINNHSIKTTKNNIQYDADNALHILVIARNIDGSIRIVLSTDPGVIGTQIENVTVQSGIRSIDSLNGIIDLSANIFEQDLIETSYYYKETEYQIFDLDFNPILNNNILGQRIVFYLVPNTNNSRTKTLFYLIVNSHGIILSTNQTDNSDLLTDIATNTFTYDIPSVDGSHLNFLDKYTLQASLTYQFTNASNPKYFVLANVTTADIYDQTSSSIIDIRKQGGGIKPELIKDLIEGFPEIQWITNFAPSEGFEYPGNGAMLIEVPTYLQKDYGGLFDDIQLRQIVEKHSVFGTYPILRGYSVDVELQAEPITSDSGVSIKLTWRSYGTDKQYNVYISTFEDRAFVKANAMILLDNLSGNSFIIDTGLSPNTTYWMYVVACDSTQNYPQTVVGTNTSHTYEVLNKVSVETYTLPS
jgi:hypothetical protein